VKPARTFPQATRRLSRPEASPCADGQNRFHRAVTVSERTVITWEEVITRVPAGSRCPDPHGVGPQRTSRRAKAEALALPWFTSGLESVCSWDDDASPNTRRWMRSIRTDSRDWSHGE
jgi:hypothetical protein